MSLPIIVCFLETLKKSTSKFFNHTRKEINKVIDFLMKVGNKPVDYNEKKA